MPPEAFAARLARWQRRHGRHGLPWQGTRDAYRRWLSEIMLQQTQVGTVVPYYQCFLERFPDVAALAAADLDEVLQAWSGLGYYSRARNLHAAAREVVRRGGFPVAAADLEQLPGVGRSTAAAIAVFTAGERAAILDGNVKRVFCRHFGVEGFPGRPAVQRQLWEIAERELPHGDDMEPYTQGLMDLGATVCLRTRPRCEDCPVADTCVARASGRIAELPAPRPRRELPLREASLLVVVGEAGVLLERRPPAGIWGGLWSLPEVEPAAAQAFVHGLGLRVAASRPLAPFLHGFTHFRLQARPLRLDVVAGEGGEPALVSAAREPNTPLRWLASHEAAGAALPRPVKTLLMGME